MSKVLDKLTNSLFIDDNLDVMSRIPSNSIDLIATDPPFNTAKFRSTKNTQYSDVWRLGKRFTDSLEEKLEDCLLKDSQKHQLKLLFNLMQRSQIKTEPSADRSFIVFMALRAIEMHRILKETGSLYWQCDPTMSHAIKLMLDIIFGKQNFINEIVWFYKTGGASKRYFSKKHDTILFYSKSKSYAFNFKKEKSYISHKYGFGNIDIKQDDQGFFTMVGLRDVWDIPALRGNQPETMGYPTQKPLGLFERIIEASSKEGDLVLDPFCGCVTTPIASLKLGRNFVGIDVNGTAMQLMQKRLKIQTDQGNIIEGGHAPIKYVVDSQLLQDSIWDINFLITKTSQAIKELGKKPKVSLKTNSKEKALAIKIDDLEKDLQKLEEDRNFLQDQLKDFYPDLNNYLDELEKPTFRHEPELSPKEKEAWKSEQIEKNKLLDGTYKCPGYYLKGKRVKCLTKKEDGIWPTANTTTIQIDRIIPASMGGKYTKSNIQAICNKCNLVKRDNIWI